MKTFKHFTNKHEKLHNELSKHFSHLNKPENESHKEWLFGYTAGSHDINTHLKNKLTGSKDTLPGGFEPHEIDKWANHTIDSVHKMSKPLSHSLNVYRHQDHDPRDNIKHGVYHTPSFNSGTINRSFINAPGGHILRFKLPKEYNKGVYVGHISDYPEEREFIMQHNQKWKHKSSRPVDGRVVHTFVPHEE